MNDTVDLERRLLALEEFMRRRETDSKGTAFGTYTPTITDGANVAASSANDAFYIRVGNNVSVWGRFDIDPTSAATLTVFDVSLPIASDLANLWDLAGVFVNGGLGSGNVGAMKADPTDDRAECAIVPAGAGNISYLFTMGYRIL